MAQILGKMDKYAQLLAVGQRIISAGQVRKAHILVTNLNKLLAANPPGMSGTRGHQVVH